MLSPKRQATSHAPPAFAASYVTGRERTAGEVNGKSANLNHALQRIFQGRSAKEILPQEIVVVFDADNVPKPEFYCKVRRVAGLCGWDGQLVSSMCLVEELAFRPCNWFERHCLPLFPKPLLEVLEVLWDKNVSLCLTPQAFHNIDPGADIFNCGNAPFWDLLLPGLDALGCTSCTGGWPVVSLLSGCPRSSALPLGSWFWSSSWLVNAIHSCESLSYS